MTAVQLERQAARRLLERVVGLGVGLGLERHEVAAIVMRELDRRDRVGPPVREAAIDETVSAAGAVAAICHRGGMPADADGQRLLAEAFACVAPDIRALWRANARVKFATSPQRLIAEAAEFIEHVGRGVDP